MKAYLVIFKESPVIGGSPCFPVLAMNADDAQERVIDKLEAAGVQHGEIKSIRFIRETHTN